MAMPIDATYENEVFVPKGPPQLKDRTRVRLPVEAPGSLAKKTVGMVVFPGTLREYLDIARMSEEDVTPG